MAVSARAAFLRGWCDELRGFLDPHKVRLAEEWRRHGLDPDILSRLASNPHLCEVLGVRVLHGPLMMRVEELEQAYTSALLAPSPAVVRDDMFPLDGVPASFADGLRDGRYDRVEWPDANAENFAFEGGPFLGEVHLLQMNRYLWPDEIEVALDKHGMRWAGAPYLMALGAQYPDVQRSVFVLSGASALVEAGGLGLRMALAEHFPMEMQGTPVSVKHLVHLHLSGGSASRVIGTTRVDRLNGADDSAHSIRILAIPK